MIEKKQNAFKALAISIILTLPLMVLVDELMKETKQKFFEENNCFDENVVCDFLPYQYVLMPIPIIIYYLSFNYFEKKRQKTWKSYR